MTELTVMTFNVKRNLLKFGRNSWNHRRDLVAQIIRGLEPDIIGTQELTEDSLRDLALLLPQYAYVGEGRGGGSKGEYTAIFYRADKFDLMGGETFWLSRTPGLPSRDSTTPFHRTCTWCELVQKEHPERPLRVYNTHLDHLSYFARLHGLRVICMEIVRRHKAAPGPVVLMGDFNASPTSITLRKWAKENLEDSAAYVLNSYNVVSRQSPDEPWGRSYHGFKGKEVGAPIDYIFTSRDIVLHRVDIYRDKVGNAFPSDHYPVVARIEF